jgi:hypothetical protein
MLVIFAPKLNTLCLFLVRAGWVYVWFYNFLIFFIMPRFKVGRIYLIDIELLHSIRVIFRGDHEENSFSFSVRRNAFII